jgi:hypothetical protein
MTMENHVEITVGKIREMIKNLPDDMKIAVFTPCDGYQYYDLEFDFSTMKFFKTEYDEWWPGKDPNKIEAEFGRVIDEANFLVIGANKDPYISEMEGE